MGFGFIIFVALIVVSIKVLSNASRTKSTSSKPLNTNHLQSNGTRKFFR